MAMTERITEMRIFVLSSMMISSAFCGIAQDVSLYNAREHGAQAKECLRVVDQDGMPVVGAKIDGGLQIAPCGTLLKKVFVIESAARFEGEREEDEDRWKR